MDRLGSVLRHAGLLTTEQLAAGLRAQVMFGGRLGTNLLEAGVLDLDVLARALGTQHGMPAALTHHFDEGDRELQERLSPETARRLECIPLKHVFGAKHGVVIASTGPLGAAEKKQIADELLVTPAQLILAVAAEMRIKYYLERIYRVERAPRYLRLRASLQPAPSSIEERRRYVEHAAEELVVRQRMARGSREMRPVQVDEAEDTGVPLDALESIATSGDRNVLAWRVLDVLDQYVPRCEAAALLSIRGGVAIGWRTFSRSGALAQEIAFALDYPGLLPSAVSTGKTQRAGADDMHAVDRILLRMIADPQELVVVPLAIGATVPALLACAVATGTNIDTIEQCTRAASAALGRLVQTVEPAYVQL